MLSYKFTHGYFAVKLEMNLTTIMDKIFETNSVHVK